VIDAPAEEKQRLLVIEDDEGLRTQLKWGLSDYDVTLAAERELGLMLFDQVAPPVVVLDLGLPPDPNGASEGLAALSALLKRAPLTKVIVASGNEERAHALHAIRLGAYDFYPKPVELPILLQILRRAFYLHQLEAENLRLSQGQSAPLQGMIGMSPKMLALARMVERIAGVNVAVLITGESGTGKEVLARALHRASPRADRPFIAINCAAIPETLLESELFGHEKGAFTGAVKTIIGKIEQADGGTLFLDEIGDMPQALQAKLLRFLQDHVIERVGGRQPITLDVRVLAATHRDLPTALRDGYFREDLFYRLNEIGMALPPLRERDGDAILLAHYFLNRFSRELDQPPRKLSTAALAAISSYGWPGNVRELENRVKRALLMADGRMITEVDLDLAPRPSDAPLMPSLREIRDTAERAAVSRALALADGNVSEAARLLGVSRPTLYDLMRDTGAR
jgi:two-component system NtrC family response regulator